MPNHRRQTTWHNLQQLWQLLQSKPLRTELAFDSAAVADLALSQQVAPALAAQMNQKPELASFFVGDTKAALEHSLRANGLRNMQILKQTVELTHALNQAGVNPLFIKGTALLLTLNRHQPGMRQQQDIDLLIPPDQLQMATEALLQLGYVFAEHPELEAAQAMQHQHHHLPQLARAGFSAHVELHRTPLPAHLSHLLNTDTLLAQALPGELNQARFYTPQPQHQRNLLLLGHYLHDGYRTRCLLPLRDALDFAHLNTIAAQAAMPGLSTATHPTIAATQRSLDYLIARLNDESPQASPADRLRYALWRSRLHNRPLALSLDALARGSYLAGQFARSPQKLGRYLRRKLSAT